MADNIKIVGNINDIGQISRINPIDTNLLSPLNVKQVFNYNEDYIEYYVYDINNILINTNYNYTNFKLPSDSYINADGTIPSIEINPIQDLQDLGYLTGTFSTRYNFFKRKISNSNAEIFISEISDDRTEIRIDSTIIPANELISLAQSLINELDSSEYQKYFLLNFPNNTQQIIVNVGIDNTTATPTVLFKLYEPLLDNIDVKTSCWVVEEIIEPYSFDLDLDILLPELESTKLKGPNFDIELDIKQNIPTGYENYNSLVSYLTGSSYSKVLNYLQDNSYDLNIDYTSFENFIHFSSAKKRLEIFKYKIDQINDYNSSIENIISGSSGLRTAETASFQTKIDNIISNFDGFENYLYFESSSYAWPKNNSVKPYINKFYNKTFYSPLSSTTWTFSHNLNEIPVVKQIISSSGETLVTQSSTVTNNTISLTFSNNYNGYVVLNSPSTSLWFNNYTSSATDYDGENLDYLYNTIPTYVKNDPSSYQSYYDFVDMIGHYFDNVWIYITSINELYNADNNLEKGISKDLVYDQLKSLGVKLYNSKGDDNFDHYISGLNSGSVSFSNDFSVTSSYLNNIPKKDLLAETFKRIYHNIPLLSKTRGTAVGLQNLITTFGVTSSILQPKEFGGSNKNNLIKGYDNDKITIINNTITGSILSPDISLQTSSTASSEFTSTDLHFVDLSFSPQNELNTRISASIASINPAFSLDDFIGDPNLMTSSSYDALIQQNNYFISASAAISGSVKRLDYKGFIELVKYFDNSLFKMLKDFVPARTNALTGVTIKSPILERNKVPVYHPKVSNENIHEADYIPVSINQDIDHNYDNLQGDKVAYFNGNISGSYIDINNYFTEANFNEYLDPKNIIDLNKFERSEFNILFNNVTSSIFSSKRKKLEKLYTIVNNKVYQTGSINFEYTSSVELQDSYLTLQSHKNSRYNGTKVSSLKYNTYTTASTTYIGDTSYGKTAAIDHNTRKIGLFTQISDNNLFNIPSRNNVALKYLVDESGSLTELNKRNKHWHELQNIFKSGETLTVELFENQKYSDQRTTDGSKSIYNSGYSYTPIIYASGSDSKLYFNYIGVGVSKLFNIKTSGGFISGSATLKYPLSGDNVFKAFNKYIDNPDSTYSAGNAYYNTGSSVNTFSTYSIQETGNQRFIAKFGLNVNFASINQTGSFVFKINKVGSGTLASQSLSAISGLFSTRRSDLAYCKKVGTAIEFPSGTSVYDINGNYIETLGRTFLYQITAGPAVLPNCELTIGTTYFVPRSYYDSIVSNYCGDIFSLPITNQKLYTRPVSSLSSTLNFNVITDYQVFNQGDQIGFELAIGNAKFSTNNFTASIIPYTNDTQTGILYNELQVNQISSGSNPFAVNSTSPYISGSTNNGNTLILNESLSYFQNYQFLPSGSGLPTNSQYNTYGIINNGFTPKVGDIIALYYGSSNNYYETIISSIYTVNNKLYFDLYSSLPSSLNIDTYNQNTINKFIILSRITDETNLILTFDRNPGNTSLGFVIPNNLHPEVLANIDTITKEVKQKLIDIGIADGGAF